MIMTTPIGTTKWRNHNQIFGIKDLDRLGHIYAIGKTGVGKSTLLTNMAISDIISGKGFALIEPHGDVCKSILDYIPDSRIKDVIYIDPSDERNPIPYNFLGGINPGDYHLAVSGLISTFKKIWADSWGPRLEHILRYTLHSLIRFPEGTLLDIQTILTDTTFRNKVLMHVSDQEIIDFWYKEYEKYSPSFRSEAISPILNKTGVFLSCKPIRLMVGHKNRSFDMQDVLDNSKILIINLSKGKIGDDASTLLGSMFINSIQIAAMARAKKESSSRTPFYLYVDEAHSFLSLAFIDILSEARKYGLGLYLTNQYIEQLDERIRRAIFGNVGTLISFRVGASDAEILAKEFYPEFDQTDLINLPRYTIYLKLMIDGTTSRPFSATTNSMTGTRFDNGNKIIEHCRRIYSLLPRITNKNGSDETTLRLFEID